MSYFQSLVYSQSIDIFAITESWLSDDIYDLEILPTNYNIYRRDRNARGGGVLLAVSNKLASKISYVSTSIELLSVEITLPSNQTIMFCCMYAPPSSERSYFQDLFHYLQHISNGARVILVGDMNLPDVNWEQMSASSSVSEFFCDSMFSLNLIQLINESTHIQGNTLDTIITNEPEEIYDIIIHDQRQTRSDHYLITFNIQFNRNANNFNSTSRTGIKKIQLFAKTKSHELLEFLQRADFHSFPRNNSLADCVNSMWSTLAEILREALTKFVPVISIPLNTSLPRYFTPKIRHQINIIRSLKRSIRINPTPHRIAKLSMLENNLQSLIDTTKHAYETRLTVTFHHEPRKLYSYLKHTSSSQSIPHAVHHKSITYNTPTDKARAFNDYFNSIFTRRTAAAAPNTTLDCDTFPSPPNHISQVTITSEDVCSALSHLEVNKAMGHDRIPPYLLKNFAPPLLEPITLLFNQCLVNMRIPIDWKIHKICPIYKSGDKTNISNYRPISLLPILSKVFESIMYNKIIDFIHPRISKLQYGFTKGRSCLSQLLTSYSRIINLADQGLSSDVIFLDFSKAFDTVPHPELLYKLWCFGITGPLWQLFKDYLSNRVHFVEIDDASSSVLPVLSGVPQGSILGPILFLIYINDLPHSITNSSVYLFADDTKFINASSNFSLLQSDIDSLQQWCLEWKINLNLSKCICLQFSFSNSASTNYVMHTDSTTLELSSSSCHRDLGIIVCNNLSWCAQYKSMCSSAYRTLNFIKRLFQASPASIYLKKSLYISLVRSKLTYCSQLWRPHFIKDIAILENVQRRATKFILNNYTSDYKERLTALQLLPLMYWYELQDLLFFIKCLKDPPDNFNVSDYVSFVTTSTRGGRSNKLIYNHTRTTRARHFYFNRIVRLWNAMPFINLHLPFHSIKKYLIKIFYIKFNANFNPNCTCTFHVVCPCSQCHSAHP